MDVAEHEVLEPTATSGPIASAVDAGAAPTLAGLLPTSDGYQRVSEVVAGLKEGIPASAPTLTASQLEDVQKIAGGAAAGALGGAPNVLTSAAARRALRELAEGYLEGALHEISAAPGAGRAAVDEAAARGVFTGAVLLFMGEEPILPADDYDAYGFTLASTLFDGLDSASTVLARAAGSPALSDVTFFSTTIAREQLGALPAGVARAQIEAIAAFGAGALDGMIEGTVTSFPQGVPAPGRAELDAWWRALATGHEGTPPWRAPGAVQALHDWADGVGVAAVAAVAAVHAQATNATPAGALDELGNWAEGLAQGAYTHLDAIVGYGPAIREDLEAYAAGVTGPAVTAILTRPHPRADPEAVQAWAFGLTGALDDLVVGSSGPVRYLESYLGPLAEAVTQIPPEAGPGQTQLVLEFLEGATAKLTTRLGNVTQAAFAEDDPALIEAMATGLATGAIALLGGPALSNPALGEALGDGLASGFLGSKDPERLFDDVDSLLFATETWFARGPPASIQAVYDAGIGAVRNPYEALRQYGETFGGAPVQWASNKGSALDVEGWGAKDDLVWIAAFGVETSTIVVSSLMNPDGTLNETELQESEAAILGYVGNVTGALNRFDVGQLKQNLTPLQTVAHARRFADYLLFPLDWLGSPGVAAEKRAAMEVLHDTIRNAKEYDRLADPAYAQAVLAFAHAMGEGIRDGARIAKRAAGDSRPEGPLVPAWARGVVAALRDLPEPAVRSDLAGRIQWVKATAGAVPRVVSNATTTQVNFTERYAGEISRWALSAPGRVPDPGTLPLPLVAWANATVRAGLERVPPILTPEEGNATLAYLVGVSEAVEAFPKPDVANWTLPDVEAMQAYVGGIASRVDIIKNDTHVWICAMDTKEIVPHCPDDTDPPCDPATEDCPGPCDPATEDCDPGCEPDCGPGECDRECQIERWSDNLQAWATGLTEAGLVQVNRTEPTQAGIEIVRLWAFQVLGGHGFCPAEDEVSVECTTPNGPVVAFAQARQSDVEGFAASTGEGYGWLVEIPGNPLALVSPVTAPLLAWTAGLENAVGTGWLQPERYLPGEGGSPPGSPVPLPEGATEEALRAWTASLWRAVPERFDDVWLPFPDELPTDPLVPAIEYLWSDFLWKGGSAAIFAAARNATGVGRTITPDTGPLDAFAAGLVQHVNASLVDPAIADAVELAVYYRGVAEGGVEAIVAAGTTIRDEQIPAIEAYAGFLASALTPPLPIQLGDEEPEEPDPPEEPTVPPEETPEPPRPPEREPTPTDAYLTNLRAHAAGLGAAILATPFDGTLADVSAYQGALGLYLQGVASAATTTPPVSPDAGFPARLQTWVQAESSAILAKQPTSPDRIGPDPDVAYTLAFVQGFAQTLPWNLQEEADGKEQWASSVLSAVLAGECPVDDASTCAQIGSTLGSAAGVGIPHDVAPLPLPPAPDQIALVDAIIEGAGPLVPALPESVGVDLVLGLLAGLTPGGIGHPAADQVAVAVANAIAAHANDLPVVSVRPTVEEVSDALLSADAARLQALANGAVARVVALGDAARDPGVLQASVRSYLSPTGGGAAAVSVTDGERTLSGGALVGGAVFDAQRAITVRANPPASSTPGTQWTLRWSAGDPNGAGAQESSMTEASGAYVATLSPQALASLARGASVRFVVVESLAGQAKVHDNGGAPYAFTPDRDAPLASVDPGTPSGATLPLAWSGSDGDSRVASYRIETREGDGAWSVWIGSTAATGASFTGERGRTYTFRVTATDAAGHVSAAATSAPIAIPASAPPNAAPTIRIKAPLEGSVHARTIPVVLEASDPDGTQPVVRVCLRRQAASVDLACPHEGSPHGIVLDAAGLADGRYRLHVTASDGTRSAEATSGLFALDRSPPAFRGAAAEASPTRVLLTAALDPDAKRVSVEAGGRNVPLADDGRGADSRAGDGVWTGEATFAPGEHRITFRAADANGNEATLAKTIVVPAPSPGPTKPGDPAPTTPDETPTTPPETPPAKPAPAAGKKGIPAPGLLAVLAALGAIAILRRRA